jgi:hypothetical protein
MLKTAGGHMGGLSPSCRMQNLYPSAGLAWFHISDCSRHLMDNLRSIQGDVKTEPSCPGSLLASYVVVRFSSVL